MKTLLFILLLLTMSTALAYYTVGRERHAQTLRDSEEEK